MYRNIILYWIRIIIKYMRYIIIIVIVIFRAHISLVVEYVVYFYSIDKLILICIHTHTMLII